MGELPHLKALVQRHADQPFAIVGVNTDRDKDKYKQQALDHGVTWRSAWEGSTDGPIPTRWGVYAYPTTLVLDVNHVIRAIGPRGEALSHLVDELLAEAGSVKD